MGGWGIEGGTGDRVVLLVLLYTNMLHVFGMVANNYNAL